MFSYNFMTSFYNLAGSGQMVTWETLLSLAADETARESALEGNIQNPQYEIEGGLVAAGIPDDDDDWDDWDDDDWDDDDWDDDDWDDDDSFIGPAAGGCGAAGVAPFTFTLWALYWPIFVRRHHRKPDC